MAVQVGVRERRALRLQGIVQGVGFRPFVYRLARRHGLSGFVRNDAGGVSIEVEGRPAALDAFERALLRSAPPAARVDAVSSEPRPAEGEGAFRVDASLLDVRADLRISPDLATCPACLSETRDPAARRHRYAFTACADCGPRFTVVESGPYDRERTSLAPFALCPACRAEYEDPEDRRYRVEGQACPACGPGLRLIDSRGVEPPASDPVAEAARRLRDGRVLAVKGLGGFHLACLAGHEGAVADLRRMKGRDEKPFAVMAADLAAARRLADLSTAEAALLSSPARPIVLLRRRPDAPVAAAVAPGNPWLGVMLPYAPLHHLLLSAVPPLVVTSGNVSDEPIALDDAEALRHGPDALLTHDRAILERCDDSVARVVDETPLVFRRARGFVPASLPLPEEVGPPTLALGGALKAVFALGRGREAILSHPLGDLSGYETFRAYEAAIERFQRLFRFSPELLVHDLHPDYPSTAYARRSGRRTLAVQHHHAHVASCMAENGLAGPVIGVAFDGTGYGVDGTLWGGEFLVGDYRGFRRAAHLEAVPMPGGERAIHEPWRMALAHLGGDPGPLRDRIPARRLEAVRALLARDLNCPRTSSMGRLFDAVSSLLGLRDAVSYEGQAAIELEGLAREGSPDGAYPAELSGAGVLRAPVRDVLDDLRRGTPKADVARRFHAWVVEAVRATCRRLREETGLDRVALSGGVFMNELLLSGAGRALARDGFRVYRHREVPPNDGGLCLGQLAVAAAGGGVPGCA